jgi:membrane-bound inhibitor of C-type lysozyme
MHAHLPAFLLSLALSACATAPEPAPTPTEVVFTCDGGVEIRATFADGSATVVSPDGTFTLPQQVMGSGIRFSDGMRTFVGKGKEMRWEFGRRAPLMCVTL